VKAAREDWFEEQIELDPERLVFIDESGLSTKMARLIAAIFKSPNHRGGGTHQYDDGRS